MSAPPNHPGRDDSFWRDTLFGRAVRDWLAQWRRFDSMAIEPHLPDGDLDRVRRQIDLSIAARGGEVAARAEAAALGHAYLRLDEAGKLRFFQLLAEDYDLDTGALVTAAHAVEQARDPAAAAEARRSLRQAATSPRLRLFLGFNTLDEGVKFLIAMRADLMALARRHGELKPVDEELFDLLRSWFDVGFLRLTQVTWQAPAALLEKFIAYEAVHAMRSWDDLKHRMEGDRRLFAFFHPTMPDEPLIFVQVALVNGMAARIPPLLDESAPAIAAHTADTAIFYSISNAQKGLAGVSFGDFLIKRVVRELSRELPNLKTFATLSPIPGLRHWLDRGLAGEIEAGTPFLTPVERAALEKALGSDHTVAMVRDLLNAAVPDGRLEPVLARLAARYLTTRQAAGEGRMRALDPVAHFHLSNGARIERLNWLADPSENGLRQSYGLMVNYLYRLSAIEDHHEAYRLNGDIKTSSAVRGLVA